MYCSTCGAALPAGRSTCGECGTRVPRAARDAAAHAWAAHPPVATAAPDAAGWAEPRVRHCPRCAYQGEGLAYFSRGAHVAALVGATVLTAGAMGAGGLIYYVVRRDHQVCPRCGYGWGKFGERTRIAGPGAGRRGRDPELPPPGREGAKNAWSMVFFFIAALMIVAGLANLVAPPVIIGGVLAAGGVYLRHSARVEREERRAALIAALQHPVLQLADRRGGRLTVTQVAAELGWTLPRAEKVLDSLEDGLRVASDVTDDGVIVYEFRELLNAPRQAASLQRPDVAGGLRPPRDAADAADGA